MWLSTPLVAPPPPRPLPFLRPAHHLSEDDDEEGGSEEEVAATLRPFYAVDADLEAQVLAAISEPSLDYGRAALPEWALQCDRLETQYAAIPPTSRSGGLSLASIARSLVRERMDPDDIQRVILGKYVDFIDIRDHQPSSDLDEAHHTLSIVAAAQRTVNKVSRRSTQPLQHHEWRAAFDVWQHIHGRFFKPAVEPIKEYRHFLERKMRNASLETIGKIIRFDALVRQDLAAKGGRYDHLGQVTASNGADELYISVVVVGPASAPRAARSTTAPPSTSTARAICRNFNNKVPNHRKKQCSFDHRCSACGSWGHPALDCTVEKDNGGTHRIIDDAFGAAGGTRRGGGGGGRK